MALTMRLLLGSLAGLLVLFQYVTMAKFHPLSASLNYLDIGYFVFRVRELVSFGFVDGLLLALIVTLSGAVVVLEVAGGHVSAFLASVFTSERSTVVLLLISSLVFVRFYLTPGDFNWAADSPQHIAYADLAADTLAQGELPFWTYALGTGSPYLQFYGFLFFWLVGLLRLVLVDTFLTLKVVLAACHVLSGLGAYAAARAGGCRRGAALVAGLGFVLCFWHTQQVLIMGRLPLSLVYALLPWPIWALERALSGNDARSELPVALFGGALLGLLVLTHPGYGYWACAFTSLYGLSRLLVADGWRPGWQRIGLTVLVPVMGGTVGAALVLPMWLDLAYTGMGENGFSLMGTPDPVWWHLLVWSNFRFLLWPTTQAAYNWYGGYLGLSLIILAVTGVIAGSRFRGARRAPGAVAAAVCLLGGLVIVFGYRTTLVGLLPNIEILGSGRYLLFVTLFLSLCAGHGVRFLQVSRRQRACAWQRVAGVATLVLVVDLGPTTFQNCYRASGQDTDPSGVSVHMFEDLSTHARTYEERGELPGYRVVWGHADMGPFIRTALLYYNTRTPVPAGPHPGELVSVFHFVHPFVQLLDAASSMGSSLNLPRTLGAGLSLLNVRNLFTRSPTRSLGLVVPNPSPVHVSARLAPPPQATATLLELLDVDVDRLARNDPRDVARAARVLTLLTGMGVNGPTHTCRTFFVDDPDAPVDLGIDVGVTVLAHTVRAQRVDLRVRTLSHCFARLAYGYYPYVDVLVDGVQVQPRVSSLGYIIIELAGGEHDIALRPRLSPLRAGLLWFSLFLVLGSVTWYVHSRRSGSI